jgi:hypothetical protein
MRRIVFTAVMTACALGCGGGGGGGDDDDTGADPLDKYSPAVQTVCHKLFDCYGGSTTDAGREKCGQQYSELLELVPDPASFSSCIQDKACAFLTSDTMLSLVIGQCIDLDESSIDCNEDGRTIHACTTKAVCSDIDCVKVCSADQETFVECSMSTEKGHDVCFCK